jgi:type I restriction enzyme S subunit
VREIASWPATVLKDLQAPKKYALNGGPFGSKLGRRDYVPSGVPVVRGANLSGDSRFNLEGFVFVSEDKADELIANNAHPGDLVFTQRGTLGQVGIIPRGCGYDRFVISQSQMKLTVDESKADPHFLYCYFRAPDTIHTIESLAFSSGVPHINLDILRHFEVRLPPLPIQQKIAAILSTYDDLIENNNRRIAILEKMAQHLYREWFVHFRFPGHESVSTVDSELGLIPEGWKMVKLGDIAEINAISIRKDKAPEWINYVNISSVSPGRIEKVEPMAFSEAPSRARRVVKRGDIIWSTVRPNRRSFCLILNPIPNLVVSTGFAVITPQTVPHTYLYHSLTTDEFVAYLTNNATGAAYPAVSTGDFEIADVLLPPAEVVESYHNIAMDLFDEKQNLHMRNDILRRTRDLLLPRLISGQLDVADLDIDTGALT